MPCERPEMKIRTVMNLIEAGHIPDTPSILHLCEFQSLREAGMRYGVLNKEQIEAIIPSQLGLDASPMLAQCRPLPQADSNTR